MFSPWIHETLETFTDHFADAYPSATADHVSFSMTGSEVLISFPGGTEHNQWWIEHAQITRPFLGAGAYEMRMDTGATGTQQFGIVFQGEDPSTFMMFMMFMMYGGGVMHGYIERFVNVDGTIYRHTPFPQASGPRSRTRSLLHARDRL